jgi:hypothetical protein
VNIFVCQIHFMNDGQLVASGTVADVMNDGLDCPSIEVRALSGEVIAVLPPSSFDETVGSLRRRLLKSVHDDAVRHAYAQSHFVYGCSVLPDDSILRDCLLPRTTLCPVAVLVLVCVRPSSLAEHLALTDTEAGGVVDVADGIFQTEHSLSMRYRPLAENVTTNFNVTFRSQVVDWIAAACHAMRFDDQLLHGAVLTLDRYAASRESPLMDPQLLSLSVAALCTEMKLANSDDFPDGCWQRSLLHLGQGRVGLPQILSTEAEILRALDFNVWVPTNLTFLRGLALRLCQGSVAWQRNGRPEFASTLSSVQMAIAEIILEVALCDPQLLYGYPAAILAAGALGVAYLATCPEACPRTDDLHFRLNVDELFALHYTLLEDVTSYCTLSDTVGLVRECEQHIVQLWGECIDRRNPWSDYFAKTCERHEIALPKEVVDMLRTILREPPSRATFDRLSTLDK